MPIVSPTGIAGRIAYLGVVRDRRETLCSAPLEEVGLTFEGFAGECHGGLTRPSCTRVRAQHPVKGTEIRNTRQISILSLEELAVIADGLGIPYLRPEWVGANLVLEGIPDLTLIPPASRLVFGSGVVITVDVENGPCRFPAEVIEGHHPGHGKAFPKVAATRRGTTGWVERPGTLALGDACRLHAPPQRLYPHL
ncbi:MAG: sulfurase [Pseudomonadota bacterium]